MSILNNYAFLLIQFVVFYSSIKLPLLEPIKIIMCS